MFQKPAFLKFGFLLMLFALANFRCEKEPLGFDMTYTKEFEIFAGLNPFDTHYFVIYDIPSDTTAFFTVNNVTKDNIKVITPKSMRMTAIFANVSYAFLNEVSVWIVSPDDPDDRKEIFYRDQIPLNEDGVLDLIPSLSDVSEYIYKGSYHLEVRLKLNSTTTQSIDTRLDYRFRAETE